MSVDPSPTRPVSDPAATRPDSGGVPDTVPPPGDRDGHSPHLPTGTRYDLRAEIARGGMGVVVRAWDAVLHRDVAVKLLHDRFAPDSPAVRRFVEEARITGQLQHPGIPPVYDLGALPDGRPFLAMKLIKGRTLAEVLDDPVPDRGALVAAFEGVCQAVAYAHSKHVVHRDLKPANVMVGAFGEVQVMDWGLAKFRAGPLSRDAERSVPAASTFSDPRSAEDGSETRAGSVLGTPAYMPPEQAIGAVDRIDERSDVFGLGAILCAVLTGRPPFVGGDAESTRQLAARGKLDDAFARLDASGAEPDLVALAKRCLAAEPTGRPAHAGEVASAVAGLRAAAEARARQAEVDAAKEVERRKRRRVQAALAGTVIGIAGLVLFGLWWQDKQAAQRRTEIAVAEAERKAEVERDAAAREAVVRRDAEVLLARIEQELRGDDLALADALLERADPTGWPADLAGRLRAAKADADTIRALDLASSTFGGVNVSRPAAPATGFRAAFARYGHPPDAARVRAATIAEQLTGGLDEWVQVEPDAGVRQALLGRLRELDADPYRTAVRTALAGRSTDALVNLAAARTAATLPDRLAAAVGRSDALPLGPALKLLRAANIRRPDSFPLLEAIVVRIDAAQDGVTPEDRTEAIGYARAAVAMRPNLPGPAYRLGSLYRATKNDRRAEEYFRMAAERDPTNPTLWYFLGVRQMSLREFARSRASFIRAYEVEPTGPAAAKAANSASMTSTMLRDTTAAVRWAEFALRRDPKNEHSMMALGSALVTAGRLEDGLAELRKAVAAGSKEAAGLIPHVELRLTFRGRVWRALDGKEALTDPEDLMNAGEMCDLFLDRPKAAVDFYAAGLVKRPKDARFYYNASRAGVRAARGSGTDAPADPAARVALRAKALGWAQKYAKSLADGAPPDAVPEFRDSAHLASLEWLANDLFDGVRHPIAVAFLPPAERDGWRAVWAAVHKTRDETAPP